MSERTWSILHATYGRPEKAVAAMLRVFERASNSADIEYIFACNLDDPTLQQLQALLNVVPLRPHPVSIKVGDFAGSAAAWDGAAAISAGDWLIQMQDDVEPEYHWDRVLLQRIGHPSYFINPIFVAVSDGYRKDALCCTAIMNRARYEQCGEFLHAGYRSVFSDDEVTYRALRDARDGKCSFIDARHIIFKHEHHYHNPAVPMDATYERENNSEAYRIGAALFAQRNPEAHKDGLRTWN